MPLDPGGTTSIESQPSSQESENRAGGRIRRLFAKVRYFLVRGILRLFAKVLYFLVAAILGVLAAFSLVIGVTNMIINVYRQVATDGFDPLRLLNHGGAISDIITLVDNLLLTLIIVEVMESVDRLREDGGTITIGPFLSIGIISAVREILAVGARLATLNLGDPNSVLEFQANMVVFGVSGAVATVLGVTLWLTAKGGTETRPAELA